ncbi:unnamed protein product [Gadus morhua 'NCC']
MFRLVDNMSEQFSRSRPFCWRWIGLLERMRCAIHLPVWDEADGALKTYCRFDLWFLPTDDGRSEGLWTQESLIQQRKVRPCVRSMSTFRRSPAKTSDFDQLKGRESGTPV